MKTASSQGAHASLVAALSAATGKTLQDALIRHFSFLADTPGYESFLPGIFAEAHAARVDGSTLIVEFLGGKEMECSAPAGSGAYRGWPATFQAVMARHEDISFPDDGGLRLGAPTNFEGSYLQDAKSALLDLVSDVQELRCPLTEFSDWWLYHPTARLPSKEPALCFFSHEGGDVEDPVEIHIGALFLEKAAEILGLDLQPARHDAASDPVAWFRSLSAPWQAILVELCKSGDKEPGKKDLAKALTTAFLEITNEEGFSLAPLESFKKLSNLRLHGPFAIADIPELAKLEELRIESQVVTSCDGLERFAKLKRLSLMKCPVDDTRALGKLKKLERLWLNGSNASSLADFKALKNLFDLSLHDTKVTSLHGVEQLKSLRELGFDNTGVTSLAPLAKMPALRKVSFRNCATDDLHPLLNCPALNSVDCDETGLSFVQLLAFAANSPGMSVRHSMISSAGALSTQLATLDEELSAEASAVLGEWVSGALLWLVRGSKWDEARVLLERFFAAAWSELPQGIGDKLAGNALDYLLGAPHKEGEFADLVVRRLIPATPQSRNLARKAAHYFASTKNRAATLAAVAQAIALGSEREDLAADEAIGAFANDEEFLRLLGESPLPDPNHDAQAWWEALPTEWRSSLVSSVGALERVGIGTVLGAKRLILFNIQSLEPLRFFPKVTSIESSFGGFRSIAPVAQLRDLEVLLLDGDNSSKKVRDITPLAGLTKLRRLDLASQEVADLGPLANHSDLEWLGLSDNLVSDISPLAGLGKLEHLGLRGNAAIRDFSPLGRLTALKELDLVDTEASNEDAKLLSELKGLEQLWLAETITSLEAIAPLELNYLAIFGGIDEDEIERYRRSHPRCEVDAEG